MEKQKRLRKIFLALLMSVVLMGTGYGISMAVKAAEEQPAPGSTAPVTPMTAR